MALPSIRYEYRIALSHVDKHLQLDTTVIAARHPSETAEHLVLRVLALCLLHRDGLIFGPGLSDGDASDLEVRDPGGRIALWVECGAVDATKLRRIVQQNAQAEVHVVLADNRRRRELCDGIAALPHGIRDAERVVLWHIDPALVAALAHHEERRQRWTVTIVEGHLYIEVNGEAFDGEAAASALPAS
jgi:uncharacterized protein YaeQ